MAALEFIEGTPPAGFKSESEQFLFNDPDHLRLQAAKGWICFHLVDREKRKVKATINLHQDGTLAESPHKAPFGSFIFSDKLSPEDLYKFIYAADAALRKKKITRVVLRNPPQAYHPSRSVLASVILMNAGYSVIRSEINTSIAVTKQSFEKGIDSWELRKLKQSKKAKLRFRPLPHTSLETVYSFIAVCREERGQSLSMAVADLSKSLTAFPKSFSLFGVFQGEEMVAASIAIHVSKRIVYNFYSAHPKRFDSLSPVVMLMEGLYDYCQGHGAEILDLGTSALGDVPNFGLLEFKLRLGGIPSARLTYGKDLE